MNVEKNDLIIIEILEKKGPLTSSELVSELVEENGKSDLSRQWILRATKRQAILKLDNISLPNNQSIYYLSNQQKILNNKIQKSIEKLDSISQRLLVALSDNSFLFLEEALKIVSAPIYKYLGINYKETRRVFDDIVDYLEEKKMIKIVNKNDIENYYIQYHPKYLKQIINNQILEDRKRQLVVTKEILRDSIKILEKMSIVGWNSTYLTNLNNENDNFNNYYFNAIGYSYSYDNYYYDNDKKKGMPVLMDIIIHREVEMYDVIGFDIRINNVKNKFRKNTIRRIIPIFFVISINIEALKFCKKKGFLIINLKDLFGNNNIKTIKSILNISNISIDSFEKYFELVKTDGRFNNVRGLLFNYMMAQMLSNHIGEKMRIGGKFSDGKEICECDIFFRDQNYIFIFETKGYAKKTLVKLGESSDEKDSVKRFFERTKKIVNKSEQYTTVVTIFITTSYFEEEAIEYMEKQKTQKNLLKQGNKALSSLLENKLYINRDTLLELCSDDKNREIKKILKEYFF